MVGLGSVCDDVRAVPATSAGHGGHGRRQAAAAVPEAELVEALAKAVMVLERSDQMALSDYVSKALVKSIQVLQWCWMPQP